jgi:asparagine synthase (glutamine-hydrolysing)
MPGLVGIVSEDGMNEQLLDRMVDSIKHEEFHRVDKYIGSHFGIARVHLGIFNPESQPIFNEDKSLCIFMDGKIYDYEEEINKLRNKHKISIGNDAEFILHSYEEYGTDFVKNLNGAFLFVICDLRENKIIIVNDRYGLRPHYYTLYDSKFLLAPECKAILQDKTFKKELNDEAVADWFAFGGILGDKTFFRGIEVLPPASIAIWDGKLSIKQYWDFNYQPDYRKSESEFVDELVKAFRKAVEIRMKDNLRYGVSLSGGLDARVVVGAIDKNKRKDVLSYTFGPLDCDEVKIAKKIAEKTGTKFKAISIAPQMIIENAEKEIFLNDGLDYLGVAYILPVHENIRRGMDVAFDGFAFDLLLGGSYLNKKILKAKSEKELFNMLSQKRLFSDVELKELFSNEYYEKIKKCPLNSFTSSSKKIKPNHPANMSDHFALQNHVRRLTLMGIVLGRNYVEFSHPTYDNNVVDIILKIPPELRYNHRIYRKFLKKLSPELAKIPYNKTLIKPNALLFLWKIGTYYRFGKELIKKWIWRFSKGKIFLPNKRSYVNFDGWFRTNEEWNSFFEELLLSKNSLSKKYINQVYIKILFDKLRRGEGVRFFKDPTKLLQLASFELFLRIFVQT